MTEPPTPPWRTISHSVQGVNKRLNQDWFRSEGQGTPGDPLILAVADGHGSAAHARSDLGARFAVDLFAAQARMFTHLAGNDAEDGPHSLTRLMNYARNDLPRRLVTDWKKHVLRHWSDHLPEPAGSAAESRDDQKLLLYGTTLIGAVLTPQLFAAWQIGDGELTVVEEDGGVTLPLAPERADLGDETESLCSRDAWRLVRVHWAPMLAQKRTPRLIALSTDGLSKSFASDEGFAQFMSGLGTRLSQEGTEAVRSALPQWLGKAARYSGDDTTLAAAQRCPGGTSAHGENTEKR